MVRNELLNDKTIIEVEDFGAGSSTIKTKKRRISRIAASSLKQKKFSRLLSRIVEYYKPDTIIELGTSFGVTTSYLAEANTKANVYTLEGAASIAAIAIQNFEALGLKNVRLIKGNFNLTLPGLLTEIKKTDFAFIDGNHRKAPTIEYFSRLLKFSTPLAIFVFDDIHWSREMEDAWEEIRQHTSVTLTIDLFFIGLVFINPDFKVKQHFKIRF